MRGTQRFIKQIVKFHRLPGRAFMDKFALAAGNKCSASFLVLRLDMVAGGRRASSAPDGSFFADRDARIQCQNFAAAGSNMKAASFLICGNRLTAGHLISCNRLRRGQRGVQQQAAYHEGNCSGCTGSKLQSGHVDHHRNSDKAVQDRRTNPTYW